MGRSATKAEMAKLPAPGWSLVLPGELDAYTHRMITHFR
jgi:hypothetical protein